MTQEEMRNVPAIDFHSHFGPINCAPDEYYAARFECGELSYLVRTMKQAHIAVSINSSLFALMPRGKGDAVAGNAMELEAIGSEKPKGVYMWAVLDPRREDSFAQAEKLLKDPRVLGIKVHPEEHRYPIREYGGKIYEFAAKNGAVIITHSGEENSLPEDFCFFANRFPEVKTICSHLGCGFDGSYEHQIRAIEMNTADNLYTDTSSARSVMSRLIEYAVGRMGSEKLLFGTDSSCYFSPSQRARIDFADIPDEDKLNILYKNGLRIFPFLKEPYERETGTAV